MNTLSHGYTMGLRDLHVLVNEYDYVSISAAVLDLILAVVALIQLLRILVSERRQALALNAPAGASNDKRKQQQQRQKIHSDAFSPSSAGSDRFGSFGEASVGSGTTGTMDDEARPTPAIGSGKWSGKKLFHGIILACMLVRGSFQAINPVYVANPSFMSEGAWLIWMEGGSALFFLAYFMLLLYWADFYYRVQQTAHNKRWIDKLKLPMFVFLGLLALGFIVAAAIFIPQSEEKNAQFLDNVAGAVMSALSLGVAAGFFYYGARLWLVLRHYRIISVRKRNQTRKVVLVAAVTTLCFAARAGLIIWSVTLAFLYPSTREWNTPWELVLFFFIGLETFPVALMLFLLRKLPNWKLDAERRGLIGQSAQGYGGAGYGYGGTTTDRSKIRYSSYSTGLYSPTPRSYSPVQ